MSTTKLYCLNIDDKTIKERKVIDSDPDTAESGGRETKQH